MSAAATRELVELAAKAAGVTGRYVKNPSEEGLELPGGCNRPLWNPVDDDGDNRRLAVRLNFTVKHASHECEVFSEDGEFLSSVPIFAASAVVDADHATDPCAASRLAVLLAAVAVAKAMP